MADDPTRRTVWVVERGSYSDYHVVGVFSTREHAQRIADLVNTYYDEATVAEWPMDPAISDLMAGRRQYRVLMLRDGAVEGDVLACEIDPHVLGESVRIWPRSSAPAYIGKGVPDCLDATVWATDATHAVKIANEHRVRFIEAGEW